MEDGGLGQISAMRWNSPFTDFDRVMLPKPPPDCILPPLDFEYAGPQLPADGNFKAEVENGSPDGGLGQISAMRWNSPFTDFDRIMLPKPPPGLFSEAKDEEASEKLGHQLPNIIRGPGGQKVHIVYRPPTSYKHKDDTGREYPKAPPNYETVLRDRKGMFFHPYIKRYPRLVAWHAVDKPRYAYN